MAFTIVRVSSGGIPVVESATGLPYYEADNGYGIPVTFGSTGIPLGTVGKRINDLSLYTIGSYSLYLHPLGVSGVTVTESATVSPSFPNGTQASWSVSGGDASTIKSFLGVVQYGNYFGTTTPQVQVLPCQIQNVASLSVTHSLTFSGTNYNVLYDIFLSTSVDGTSPSYEVEVFLHSSSAAQSWFSGLTTIGTTTISGISWDVKKSADVVPQIAFMPTNRADVASATIDLLAMLNYLVGAATITSKLFYSGHALGPESIQGGGSITVNSASVAYTLNNPVQANYITQQNLTNAYWSKQNVTASASDTLMETAVNNKHQLQTTSNIARTAAAKTFVLQVDVSMLGVAPRQGVLLNVWDGAFNDATYGGFDILNKSALWLSQAVWTGGKIFAAPVPGTSDVRCFLQFTTDATTTDFSFWSNITSDPAGGLVNYLGDTSKGFTLKNLYLFNRDAASGGS